MGYSPYTAEQMISALEKTKKPADAAEVIGCAASTVRRWIREEPEVTAAWAEIKAEAEQWEWDHKPNQQYTTSDMVSAVMASRGNLTTAARMLGCSRTTVHDWVNRDELVKRAYKDIKEVSLDFTENKLLETIEDKNVTSIIFYLKTQGKHRGWNENFIPESTEVEEMVALPADALAGTFTDVYRELKYGTSREFILKGGRGSTKSSFSSFAIVEHIVNNPTAHGLAVRQVAATLRDSVFAQIQWAIEYLGLSSKFKFIRNPLEITYLPTGQMIYFRGADDPLKIKSIKPPFGAIEALWFEELDQFGGAAEIRSVVQSAIRGGDTSFILKSFNPPKSKSNWVNKETEIPKDGRYVHHSTFKDVPKEWLGKVFLEEAEFLKKINPRAYKHEYLGIITGTGGLVFENVVAQEITDEEIANFERILYGLDWGYFPHPAHAVKMTYDPTRLTLYIYGEVRKYKASNRELYDAVVETLGLKPDQTIICDSAEPKSIADFRDYGASARGAEKGPESVKYSMKWLQSLLKIVIDPVRAPETLDEFLNYEHEMNKDGEYISSYPDKKNHGIDGVRYGTNRIWARRGQ